MRIIQTQYAGLWPRITAHCLDQIILGLPFIILLGQVMPFFIDYDAIKKATNQDVATTYQLLSNLIYIEISAVAIWSALIAVFVAGKWHASPGKRIMGIYIMKRNGEKLKFHEAFMRTAILPLAVLMVQIPGRAAMYEKLPELNANPERYKNMQDIVNLFAQNPIIAYSDIAAFVVGVVWLIFITFTAKKTAIHDILYETRVVYGKK